MIDHVHILARLWQDKAISAVIGAIKANLSGWIHREFPDLAPFEWQSGYAAFSVSKSQEPRCADTSKRKRNIIDGNRSRRN